MATQARHHGGNLMLASALALLSYVPFQLVAKISLILCVLVFIVDPIPPMSRLLSLVAVMVVALLTKAHRRWEEENQTLHSENELQQQEEKELNKSKQS